MPENIVGTEIRCGKLEQEKEAALKAGDIEKASELHREQKEAEKKLEQAKKRFNKKNEKKKVPVTEEDVADVISMWTRIPVTRLNESESERLKKLDKTLEKRVIGQEEAIQALSKSGKTRKSGIERSGTSDWFILIPWSYRCRKDRAFQSSCRSTLWQ